MITKLHQKNKRGFTIIEVVLVLAIAGLIFLMVFIALPALQRSQRDTQRRSDLARFASAINQYQANNKGSLPTAAYTSDKFIANYLGGAAGFVDPDGTNYKIVFGSGAKSISGFDHNVYFQAKAKCSGESAVASTNARDFAILYKLESSGVYCSDNK